MASKKVSLRHISCVILGMAMPLSAYAEEPNWDSYAQLLQRYVSPGAIDGVNLNQVDYSRWRNDPLWPQVVNQITSFPLDKLADKDEQLSFYINAYNILAIKMVLDHWPVESIKEAGSLLRPVWRKEAGTLGGQSVTLQKVEDERLRALGEPRIHMAIVCASVSCPDLRAEPYRAASLYQQLDDQATAFLQNPAKGLRVDDDTVTVSKIFDWFEDDFTAQGGVAAFIRRYHPLADDSDIDADIEYNWNLNGR